MSETTVQISTFSIIILVMGSKGNQYIYWGSGSLCSVEAFSPKVAPPPASTPLNAHAPTIPTYITVLTNVLIGVLRLAYTE